MGGDQRHILSVAYIFLKLVNHYASILLLGYLLQDFKHPFPPLQVHIIHVSFLQGIQELIFLYGLTGYIIDYFG